jgi:hypothetical protein
LAMNKNFFRDSQGGEAQGFGMFRLSHGKECVDICANTLRAYNRAGLPFYRMGKAVFISKAELAAFIRAGQENKN